MGDLLRVVKGRIEQWVCEHPFAALALSGSATGIVVGGLLGTKNWKLAKRLSALRSASKAKDKASTSASAPSSSAPSSAAASSSSGGGAPGPLSSASLSSMGAPLAPPTWKVDYIDPKASKLDNFVACFDVLLRDLVEELPSFELPDRLQEYFAKMQQYNCVGGKMNRGLSVLDTFATLKNRGLMKRETAQAHVLGWCVELLQAFFLVADDVMDNSVTRRGQPCWFRLEHVGLNAINDSFLLESSIYRLLRKYFGSHAQYSQILDLFHEVTYQTEIGQLLDLTSADLDTDEFKLELHTKIVKYKTAFYSFYLPVALGMVLSGIQDPRLYSTAQDILVDIGVYFQVQDDFLDGFQDPEILGKKGTDIEDRKCSWLVIQALQRCSPVQRAHLKDIYGKKEHVDEVKGLYETLNLRQVYEEFEEREYARIQEKIRLVEGLPHSIFTDFLEKIYKRQK